MIVVVDNKVMLDLSAKSSQKLIDSLSFMSNSNFIATVNKAVSYLADRGLWQDKFNTHPKLAYYLTAIVSLEEEVLSIDCLRKYVGLLVEGMQTKVNVNHIEHIVEDNCEYVDMLIEAIDAWLACGKRNKIKLTTAQSKKIDTFFTTRKSKNALTVTERKTLVESLGIIVPEMLDDFVENDRCNEFIADVTRKYLIKAEKLVLVI